MSDFDTAVAQQVARAWALERALHAPGPWILRSEHFISFADRIIDESNQMVIFMAPVYVDPDAAGEAVLELVCDGEEVSSRTVDLPAGDSVIEWELSLAQTATV